MSEKEIRAKLEQMCSRLDRNARSAGWRGARGAIFPVVLSAGLVTTACGDDEGGGGELYAAPGGYTSTSSTGTGGDGGSGGASTGGSGGASTGGSGGDGGGIGGGAMEYAAPDP
ncbi:MAG: hypothetical protein JRI68_22360 [Deltaproteobacteria bacterium]|nr:hypothetical protein [Deltaproteobacteria bacterium]